MLFRAPAPSGFRIRDSSGSCMRRLNSSASSSTIPVSRSWMYAAGSATSRRLFTPLATMARPPAQKRKATTIARFMSLYLDLDHAEDDDDAGGDGEPREG